MLKNTTSPNGRNHTPHSSFPIWTIIAGAWWQTGTFSDDKCTHPFPVSAVPFGAVYDIVSTANSKDACVQKKVGAATVYLKMECNPSDGQLRLGVHGSKDSACSGKAAYFAPYGCERNSGHIGSFMISSNISSNMMCTSTGDMVVRNGTAAVPPSFPEWTTTTTTTSISGWWLLGTFTDDKCTHSFPVSAVPPGEIADLVLTANAKDACLPRRLGSDNVCED
eukprot:324419-Amphidinium_carterae.1